MAPFPRLASFAELWPRGPLTLIAAALLSVFTVLPPAAPLFAASSSWEETTQDVWIDGQLAQGARVLVEVGGERSSIFVPGEAAEVWVLDDAGTVHRVGADLFSWTGPGQADADIAPSDEPHGTWAEIDDDQIMATADGKALLVRRHRGMAGELEPEDIWATVPLWKDLADDWLRGLEAGARREDAEAIEDLATLEDPTELEVFFGTWCGDSRRSVPRLLMALEKAANPSLTIRLVSIERGFEAPLGRAVEHQVTNVPTVIVRRDGRELGRFVEQPRGESVVTDVAAILRGRPTPARELFHESDRVVARGRLRLIAQDGTTRGHESWTLFATGDGGRRLHAEHLDHAGHVTEIWQRWDDAGQTRFLEVTRDGSTERSRTRLYRRGEGFSSLTRGDASGIVEQIHEPAPGTVVTGPSLASVAQVWAAAGRPDHRSAATLRVPGAGHGFAGRTARLDLRRLERSSVEVQGRMLPAERVALRLGDVSTQWWLDPGTSAPLRMESSDGTVAELLAFELMEEDDEASPD